MIVKPITEKQKEQLLKVIPSRDSVMEYRPCQVSLKNGEIKDFVYVVEENSYMRMWGVMPDADSGKSYILIEEVENITSSPNRLKPELANKLYEAGESGMGYCVFKVIFDNGQTLDVLTGNAIDFIPIPKGLTAENIMNVLPHEGSRKNYIPGPDYYWCLYKDDIYKK